MIKEIKVFLEDRPHDQIIRAERIIIVYEDGQERELVDKTEYLSTIELREALANQFDIDVDFVKLSIDVQF